MKWLTLPLRSVSVLIKTYSAPVFAKSKSTQKKSHITPVACQTSTDKKSWLPGYAGSRLNGSRDLGKSTLTLLLQLALNSHLNLTTQNATWLRVRLSLLGSLFYHFFFPVKTRESGEGRAFCETVLCKLTFKKFSEPYPHLE